MPRSPTTSDSDTRPDSTFLETQETKVGQSSELLGNKAVRAHESSVAFRHRMYEWHRKRVVQAFERLLIHESRMYAYLGCGSGAWVVRSRTEPDRYALRSECCHDRWCPACSKARAMVLRSNLEPLLQGRTIRFVTLTLKHDDSPLAGKLDRLQDHFKTLRTYALWKEHVDAGIAFVEVKHNSETGRWHPHLHVLTVGRFLRQQQLRDAWLAVTGDSHVVDVRLVKDESEVAKYVTKYVTKPCGNELYRDSEALDQAILALKGRRMVTTFGAWRGKKLLHNDSLTDWEPLMSWPELLRSCRMGDAVSIEIYVSVTRREWCADDTSIDSARPPPF